jgi:hypothetical protein
LGIAASTNRKKRLLSHINVGALSPIGSAVMTAMGQKRKFSPRAHVVRFAPESGNSLAQLECPPSANSGGGTAKYVAWREPGGGTPLEHLGSRESGLKRLLFDV